MFETSDPEINVDRLMRDIREAVARQRQVAAEIAADSLSHSPPTADPAPPAQNDSSAPSLQPEFRPRDDDQYHVNDLLKYHGGEFVRNAYLAVLKREPDEAGLAHHLENLAGGRLNKVDVLASLRSSPEGERAGVRIDGLALPAAIRRLGRVPVVGYLIQTAVAAARLPQLLRHQRQSEFYLLAQQRQIVERYDRVHARLSARADGAAEEAVRQRRVIESLAEQQQGAAERLTTFKHEVESHLAAARLYTDRSAAELTGRLEEQARQLLERLRQTHEELATQERRVTLLLEEARARMAGGADQQFLRAAAEEEDHLLDPLYASFEDQFRGEREEIKSRLRVYLPILRGAGVTKDVLDIGSGRGEWLEALKEEGVQSRGVDHNRVFVAQCRERGLDVAEADALAYLRSLPDQSLDAVTSFHLVEHLPFETLVKLLDESVRTLRRGGLLILETPNPENVVVGSYSFYADPTHRNPIPSPTLQFLLEARGLSRVEVMKLRPRDEARIEGDAEIVKRFNEHFCSAPDYGIVGWKD
jgi:SAM-dependent methyltransferase